MFNGTGSSRHPTKPFPPLAALSPRLPTMGRRTCAPAATGGARPWAHGETRVRFLRRLQEPMERRHPACPWMAGRGRNFALLGQACAMSRRIWMSMSMHTARLSPSAISASLHTGRDRGHTGLTPIRNVWYAVGHRSGISVLAAARAVIGNLTVHGEELCSASMPALAQTNPLYCTWRKPTRRGLGPRRKKIMFASRTSRHNVGRLGGGK